MTLKIAFTTMALLGAAAAPPAFAGAVSAGGQTLQKMPVGDGKVQTKHGYWQECDSSGQNCHTIYMSSGEFMANGEPAPGAAHHRIRAKTEVKAKDGYWVECDGVGNCHYVYMFAPMQAK